MKVYITKYALTNGIQEEDAEEIGKEGMVRIKDKLYGHYIYFTSKEWFSKWEDAVADARVRRDKKIRSLDKQLIKLLKLEWT